MRTDRSKLNLTKEEAKDIINGDGPDSIKIISDEIIDHGRWTVNHSVIIQDLNSNKFYQGSYSRGATESQDEYPYDYSEPNFIEVFPVEKTIIVYE